MAAVANAKCWHHGGHLKDAMPLYEWQSLKGNDQRLLLKPSKDTTQASKPQNMLFLFGGEAEDEDGAGDGVGTHCLCRGCGRTARAGGNLGGV